MNTYNRDRRFKTLKSQCEKITGHKIEPEDIFSPRSIYDAEQWCVKIMQTTKNHWIVIEETKYGFDIFKANPFELPSMAYDTKDEQKQLLTLAKRNAMEFC